MRSKYFIGQPLFKHHPLLPDGMYYRYQDREHLVMYISPNVSSPSINDTLLSGPAEFAFAMQEGVLFFLARFGHYHWRKAPYYWHGVPEAERTLPVEVEKPDGSADLQILLIDDMVGCVQGVRTVVFPPDFTAPLHQAIGQQAASPNMGGKRYREALARVHEKFPRPKDLLEVALGRMTDNPSLPTFWKTARRELDFPSEFPGSDFAKA